MVVVVAAAGSIRRWLFTRAYVGGQEGLDFIENDVLARAGDNYDAAWSWLDRLGSTYARTPEDMLS